MAAPPVDAEIVRALDAIARDWNTFDLDRYVPVYADDATYVTRHGTFMQGRDEIRRGHETAWEGPLRYHMTIEPLYSRAIGNDHVLAHARLVFRAAEGGDTVGASTATVVFVRTPDGYRIQSAQTTSVVEA